jgi:hypothetical protein
MLRQHHCCPQNSFRDFLNSSGSFATLAAIRLASSFVSNFAAN